MLRIKRVFFMCLILELCSNVDYVSDNEAFHVNACKLTFHFWLDISNFRFPDPKDVFAIYDTAVYMFWTLRLKCDAAANFQGRRAQVCDCNL